jgi:hypothetical protein
MKDNFEKFIEKHRSELDVFEPREDLWDGVNERLPKQKKKKQAWYYALAASILLLAGAIIWLRPKPSQSNNATETVSVNPEERRAEVYYASLIDKKRKELSRYCSEEPKLCNEFEKELDTLNVLYGQLKQEYNTSSNNEAVLQAMINNLQLQLQVLSQQLQIIQNIKARNEQIKVS